MENLLKFDFEEYEILDLIGQGGMSRVYLAKSRADDVSVAIKILAPQTLLDPKFTTRFNREIRVLSRLRHPNIVPILDYGEVEGFPYIVMPYSTEGTLQDRIKSEPISIAEVSTIISDLSGALQYLHEKGIVHRDVKPSNILIDEEGSASLSDFGLVREIDAAQSLTGSFVIGTPAFMSPEQCAGTEVSAASDQYSLSVVLYQLLTGRIPFEAKTPMAILVKQMHDPVPLPRMFNPEVPLAIEKVLLKGLDKDPSNRFGSIIEFNDVFQDALLEVVDPVTGNFIPDSLDHEAITEALSEGIRTKEDSNPVEGIWYRLPRPVRTAMALLPMLGLIFLPGVLAGMNGAEAKLEPQRSATATEVWLQATIDALSTENANAIGFMAFPGQVETAVAGTLQAMEATLTSYMTPTVSSQVAGLDGTLDPTMEFIHSPVPTTESTDNRSSGGSSPQHTPTATSNLTGTPTPNSTLIGSPSPTSGGGPTPTSIPPTLPNPTATAVLPTATSQPPTATAVPPTQVPPTPVPPKKCLPGKPPGHPLYCPPSP